jgi:hypothetical protein
MNGLKASLLDRHRIDGVYAHRPSDLAELVPVDSALNRITWRSRTVLATRVPGVVERPEGVGHRVHETQSDVGEAHPGDVLAKGRPAPRLSRRRAPIQVGKWR